MEKTIFLKGGCCPGQGACEGEEEHNAQGRKSLLGERGASRKGCSAGWVAGWQGVHGRALSEQWVGAPRWHGNSSPRARPPCCLLLWPGPGSEQQRGWQAAGAPMPQQGCTTLALPVGQGLAFWPSVLPGSPSSCPCQGARTLCPGALGMRPCLWTCGLFNTD